MKDNFSSRSDNYAKYRPIYPDAIFTFLKQHLTHVDTAWDCGTGNGQIAVKLAQFFRDIYASDISENQIQHATPRPNVHYSVHPAEQTNFPANTFDLIVVAQAIHWFDFDHFYAEVRRVARSECLFAVIGYGRAQISPEVDAVVDELYHDLTGPHWDPERHYIDDGYKTIPFPFMEIQTPPIENVKDWTVDHFLGYLNTWSGVKHYSEVKGQNPVDIIEGKLKSAWGKDNRTVIFPLLFRLGKVS